jgi:hypothetical protein
VSDDASCEKIRLALESCEVEKDILSFIKERGTGQEIPDPPRYINFCRGDLNDTASEASEDENYSVAQFPRTVNPAFRSASPNPSTYESHHDPHSELAQQMGHGGPPPQSVGDDNDLTPSKTNSGRPQPLNYRPQEQNVPPNYSPSQHGDVTNVPHNEYPTEGMTMFCRTGPPSVTGSGLSNNTRPSSRDSQSDYSNPTSYTSADPVSGKSSPTKGMPPVNGVKMAGMSNASPVKAVQKKRSGFFSNSPFRRKSKKEQDHAAHTPSTDRSNRNTWAPQSGSHVNTASTPNVGSTSSSPTKSFGHGNMFNRNQAPPDGEEQADPRATFQLNVGNNVFDVASPDSQTTPKGRKGFPGPNASGGDMTMDPLKQALMDLQQGSGGMGKQSSTRVTADRYHGIKTPAPDPAAVRPAPLSAASADRIAAQRGTPPPAYEGARVGAPPALGVPQPAFTSKEMRKRTETWGHASNGPPAAYPSGRTSQGSRPGTRDDSMQRSRSPGPGMGGMPRAASPQPMRARSPAPDMMRSRSPGPPMNSNMRARSPAPPMNPNIRARSPAPPMNPNIRARSPGPQMNGHGQYRAASPNPYADGRQTQSQQNSGGMEIQLSSQDVQRYDAGGSNRSRHSMMDRGGRPGSGYGGESYTQQQGGRGMDPQMRRERSKSMAPAPSMGGVGGKGVLHYGE